MCIADVTSKVGSALRLNVSGANILFSADCDPTSLKTNVARKLVKKIVLDGVLMKKGSLWAEIEVMKVFMPLMAEETGVIT